MLGRRVPEGAGGNKREIRNKKRKREMRTSSISHTSECNYMYTYIYKILFLFF